MKKMFTQNFEMKKMFTQNKFYSLNCLAGLLVGEVTDNLPSSKRALLPHFLQHDVRSKIFMIYQTYLIFFKFAPQRSDAVPSLKKDCCLSNNVRDYHFVSQVQSGCLPWPCSYKNRKLGKQWISPHQGGRTWQAFGGGKNGHETFRQARIYNFRDKCVVFARNLKFSNLTQ